MKLGRLREEWPLLLLAVGCLALAWVFAKLGSEVMEGELAGIDRAAREWVLSHRTPTAVTAFQGITLLGDKRVLVPLAVLLGWRVFRDSKHLLVLLTFAALACAEFVTLLKRNLRVVRPIGGIEAGLGFSFPSGHASGSVAVATVLSYAALRKGIHPRLIVTTSAILALLVGVSRVWLDVHWTSDVLGGWLVGAAFGVGCCALYEWMSRRENRVSA